MSGKALATELEPEVPEEEIAEAAEQPAEETPAEEKPKAEEKKEPPKEEQKLVPHQALHEERERRKAIQREIEEERRRNAAQMAVLNDRLQQIYQATNQREQPQFQDPEKAEDPLKALHHNQALTAKQMAELQHRLATEDWQRQQAAQTQQLVGWAQSKAQEFRSETPDFDQAYEHIRGHRLAELKAMGLPPQAIAQTLYQDEIWVMQHAAQAGKNPAEILYQMAVGTGYKKSEEKPKAEQKIEQLQKGTAAAKSLGNGGSSGGMPTPEQIAEMDPEEFEAFKASLRAKGKRLSDVI